VDAPVSVNLHMEHSDDIREEESENGVVSSTGMVSEKAMMKWFCSRETDHQAVKFLRFHPLLQFRQGILQHPGGQEKALRDLI
jgi:hypothetical protein